MSNRQPNPTIRAPPMPHPGSRNNDSHRSSTTLASYHSATDSASTHVPEDAQTVSTKTSCNEDRPTTTSISSPSPMPASDAHLRSQNSDLRPSPTTTVSASASTPFDVDLERGSTGSEEQDESLTRLTKEDYNTLTRRFTIQVTLSTFACVLIVTYCSLINAVVSNVNKHLIGGTAFNIGLLLSFIAISLHAGSAVIAGRAVVVCSEPDLKDQVHRTKKYFANIFTTCEHLDVDGTIVFVAAVFETSFLMFKSHVYPAVFCGVSVLALGAIIAGKYRQISVLWKDFRWFVELFEKRWWSQPKGDQLDHASDVL